MASLSMTRDHIPAWKRRASLPVVWLWRAIASLWGGIALLVLSALALLPSVLFGPRAIGSLLFGWALSDMGRLDELFGTFYRSVFWRGLLALAAAGLILRIAAKLSPRSLAFGGHVLRRFALRGHEDVAKAEHALREAGYQLEPMQDDGHYIYQLACMPWSSRLLSALSELGLLLILIAAAIQAQWGWQSPNLVLLPQEPVVIDEQQGVSVIIADQDDGRAKQARLMLTKGDTVIKTTRIGPGRPIHYDGLWLHQIGEGAAVRVAVYREDYGHLVLYPMVGGQAKSLLRMAFTQDQSEHLVGVPEAGLVLRLSGYNSDVCPSKACTGVEIYRSKDGVLLDEELVSTQGRISVGEVEIRIINERYIMARAVREPSLPIALLGGACAICGVFIVPFRRRPAVLWLATPLDRKNSELWVWLSPSQAAITQVERWLADLASTASAEA